MATLTWLNGGVDHLLRLFLNKDSLHDVSIGLYTNNHTPAVSDGLGSYTLCTLTGYAAVDTTPSSWAGGPAAGVATYTYPAITFNFSAYAGGTTIYGVVLYDGSGTAWAAALLDTPYAVPAGGGSLVITPALSTKQCA